MDIARTVPAHFEDRPQRSRTDPSEQNALWGAATSDSAKATQTELHGQRWCHRWCAARGSAGCGTPAARPGRGECHPKRRISQFRVMATIVFQLDPGLGCPIEQRQGEALTDSSIGRNRPSSWAHNTSILAFCCGLYGKVGQCKIPSRCRPSSVSAAFMAEPPSSIMFRGSPRLRSAWLSPCTKTSAVCCKYHCK